MCRVLYSCDKWGLETVRWSCQPGFDGAQYCRIDRASVPLISARDDVSVLSK